ncbi:MAG: InlB B-repeat-containing protein, partial [Lachnospiraceae bacterium]|nr:InlB B-repeat-containing protein [Lachnospiraceae bacterium]
EALTQLSAERYTNDIVLYAKWTQKIDITGKVKMIYNPSGVTQQQNQKTKDISLVLQRRLKNIEDNFVDIDKTLPIQFTDTTGDFAIESFEFKDMPATDMDGNEYEYQVTSITANYSVTQRGIRFEDEEKYQYNLELTYSPDTFVIKTNITSESNIEDGNLPTEVIGKIVFRNTEPTENFSAYTVPLPEGNPSEQKDDWIYITEHKDATISAALTGGDGEVKYYVNKYWNTDITNKLGHYQFVVTEYKMPDGTIIEKGSSKDPFILTYTEPCAVYDESYTGTDSYVCELNLNIDRYYEVSFDLKGRGTLEEVLKSSKVKNGSPVAEPTQTITEKGYQLEGWYANKDCTGTKWEFDTNQVRDNMTLYANWTANEYDIVLDNGSGIENQMVKAVYDKSLPDIKRILPEKSGMTFAGYYTRTNGLGECYYTASGDPAKEITSYTNLGNLTLYAFWKNDVTVTGTATIHYNYLENGTTPENDTVGSEIPSTERIEKAEIQLQRSTDGENFEDVKGETREITFKLVEGKKNTASGTYSFTGLSAITSSGETYKYRVTTSVTKYDVEIQEDKDNEYISNLELTYHPNNFDLPITVDASRIPAADRPVKVNVQVTYRGIPGNEEPEEEYTGKNENWPVIGQLKGGNIELELGEDGKASEKYSVWKTTQDNDGVTYKSWYQIHVVSYVYKVDGKEITQEAESNPFFVDTYGSYGNYTDDTDITGVSAVLDRTYTVAFDTQGKGDSKPVTQNIKRNGTLTDPGSSEITAEGYHISGWYTTADCKEENQWVFEGKNESSASEVTKNITLYAKWEADTYSIFYHDDEKDVPSKTESVTYLGQLPESRMPNREGYVFGGYYTRTEEGIEDTCYYDAAGNAKVETYEETRDIHLYAKWIQTKTIEGKVKINYTYVVEGQTITMENNQRRGSINVVLERRIGGEEFTQVSDSTVQTVTFSNFQGEGVKDAVGDFSFTDMPLEDENGNSYEYRATSVTTNYIVTDYKAVIDNYESDYNFVMIYEPNSFSLKMTIDASGIPSQRPQS